MASQHYRPLRDASADALPEAGGFAGDLPPDQRIEALSAQAERCRRLAGVTYNREVSEILGSMGDQYQRSAEELSRSLRD